MMKAWFRCSETFVWEQVNNLVVT